MPSQHITDVDIAAAMIDRGDNFAAALGRAWAVADRTNQERIKAAFPDLWDTYADVVRNLRQGI